MIRSKRFDGQVKYSSSCEGSIKWKMGTLVFTKDDNWWHMDLVYSCTINGRPAQSILLTPEAIKKTFCRELDCFFEFKLPDKSLISIQFCTKNTVDIKEIEAIFAETMSAKTVVKVNKSEVAVQSVPQKSGLFTSVGNMNNSTATDVVDTSSPKKFTSVKENKKVENDMLSGDGKENHLLNSNRLSNNFLQRSVEKSQNYLSSISAFYGKSAATVEALFSSTPQTINVKRTVGLMPDPTASKRPRLSESISYTMQPKSTQPVDQNNQQSLQGFSNLGNTCYMNAILQSLFCLDSFCSDLTANRKLRNLQPQSLYYSLAKLLCARRQTSENCRRDCLRRVKSAISNTAKRFSGYNQHDAHEFLGQVLDQLKEEVIKVSKSTPSPCLKENMSEDFDEPSANNHVFNPITVNFEFEVMHTLTCLKCQEQVTKTEQFHDISLDVPKHKSLFTPRSLQDALTLFFKTEQFDYTCEKCGHNKSEVSHKITRLPRVFILHLKRYTYNQQSSKNTKMGQNVAIPAYVTFQAHCTKDTQPATGLTFQAHCGGGEGQADGEGQAVYSSVEHSCSDKNSMSTTPEDSKYIPSRRELKYSVYRFQTTNDKTSLEQHKEMADVCFTETKDKVDSLDLLPSKSLTLEDDDSDYAKAIELSLKEQEERDQLHKDYGEDTESSFEKVLELSRHENGTEDLNQKRLQDLTDDEMLQIAIEQSLMDTDSLNNVYMDNDTSQKMDYKCMHNDDIIGNDAREHDYTGSYDIGPDGDYLNTQISKSKKSYCRNRKNVDRAMLVNNKDNVKQELYKSDGITIENNAVVSEDLKQGNHDILNTSISGDTTTDSVRKDDDEIDQTETSSKSINKREIRNRHFGEKLHSLSNKFSVEDNLLCKEEMLLDLEEASKYGSGNKICNSKSNLYKVSVCKGQTYELHDSIDTCHRENTSDSINLNRTITEKKGNRENLKEDIENEIGKLDNEKVKFVLKSNKSGNKSGTRTNLGECSKETVNVDVNSPIDINNSHQRTFDLTSKEVNVNKESICCQKWLSENDKESSEDDFGLSNDRDDSWLSLIDDKENAIPYTNSPKLSDPSEFSDSAEAPSDETDGFVEEILHLPEIINEKGELPYSYKLVSIVNHIGLSSTTGHYQSDVYDMKKKTWYTIDDVRVEKTSEATIRVERERTGYIFFYMNKDIFDALTPCHDVNHSLKKVDIS